MLALVLAALLCGAAQVSAKVATPHGGNALSEFFSDYEQSTIEKSPAVQELPPEPPLCYYDLASGRGVWLSPDPMERVTGEMAEMLPEGSNLYIYVGNDPVNAIDLYGLEVYVSARGLNGPPYGRAVHTYVEVVRGDGTRCGDRITYGGYKDGKNLAVRRNDPSDRPGSADKGRTLVPPPPGMSQEEWDSAVIKSGERALERSGKRKYKALGGDGGVTSGNCNSTTSDIIEDAGGAVPEKMNPNGYNPGLRD